MNFSDISTFSWPGSWDWLIILIFLVIAFIYGLSMGRNRLVIVIFGTYLSFILVNYFPWSSLSFASPKTEPSSTVQIFAFLAIILAFYFLIPHSALGSSLKLRGRGKASWWQALFLSFLQMGLIVAIVVGFLPQTIVNGLSQLAKIIFVGSLSKFLWLLLPVVAIMLIRRRKYEAGD